MTKRTLDYCDTTAAFGPEMADVIWDRTTPNGVDVGNPGDELAMFHRMQEREDQNKKCKTCLNPCW